MINLAGVLTADEYIREELYLAGISEDTEKSAGEVPSTFIGKLPGWTFRRAWTYYTVTCLLNYLGLPYSVAVELHERRYPISSRTYNTLGQVIRVGGDCTCPHPEDCVYPSLEDIEKECREANRRHPTLTFDSQDLFDKATTRELDGERYIRLYHIDTIVGLKAFADVLRGLV